MLHISSYSGLKEILYAIEIEDLVTFHQGWTVHMTILL